MVERRDVVSYAEREDRRVEFYTGTDVEPATDRGASLRAVGVSILAGVGGEEYRITVDVLELAQVEAAVCSSRAGIAFGP